MTKPQQKKHQKLTILLKILLISTAVLLLLAPIAYITYQKYLENQEAKNFAALKVDFLELQKEFNKIDPGWEYSERCDESGSSFGRGQITCSIDLSKNEQSTADIKRGELYENTIVNTIPILKTNMEEAEGVEYYVGFKSKRFDNSGGCNMSISDKDSYVGCTHFAESYYY